MRKSVKITALLATVAALGCGKVKPGGDDSESESEAEKKAKEEAATLYEFKAAPAALTLQLPSALTAETGSKLRLQGPPEGDEGPSTGQSQGYFELTEKTRRVQMQLADLSLHNTILDAVITEKCNFAASSTCTAENACSKLSDKMLAALKKSLGSAKFEDNGELGKMAEQVNQEICFKSVTVTKLGENAEKFAYKADVVLDSKNSFSQSWNETKDRVKVISTFEQDFSDLGDAMPVAGLNAMEPPKFSGTSTFVYDAAKKNLKAENKIAMSFMGETHQSEESFQIQGVEADDKNIAKVVLKVQIKTDDGLSLSIEGTADDKGGFVRTQLSHSQFKVTKATLSKACEASSQYVFYGKDTTSDNLKGVDIFAKQVGSFSCNEAATNLDLETSGFFVMKSLPDDRSELVLFTMDLASGLPSPGGEGPGGEGPGGAGPGGEGPGGTGGPGDPNIPFDPNMPPEGLTVTEAKDPFAPTLNASDIKFTELEGSVTIDGFCFEEEFTKEGEITAWRSAEGKCDGANTKWAKETGTFGSEYKFDEETEGAKIPQIKLKLKTTSGPPEFLLKDFLNYNSTVKKLPVIKLVATKSNCRGFTAYTDLFLPRYNCEPVEVGTMNPNTEDIADAKDDLSNYTVNFTGTQEQLPCNAYIERGGTWLWLFYEKDRLYKNAIVEKAE